MSSPHEVRRPMIANGYELVLTCGKAPGYQWRGSMVTLANLAELEARYPDHANTGIRTGRCVAVDNDLTNAAHAAEIEKLAETILGPTLLSRVGAKGPTHCYRNEAPISKITIGTKQKRLVEILGSGQQFIAYGIHPGTGNPYQWTNAEIGGEPTQTPLSDLPEVTPAQLEQFARAVAEKLKALGYGDVQVTGIKTTNDAAAPASGKLVSFEIIKNMLRCIPPSCGRSQWLTVGGGLVNAPVSDPNYDGRAIYTSWSRGDFHGGPPDNFQGAEDCEAQWNRDAAIRDGGGHVPAFGALVNLARECGYDGPSFHEDFADYRASTSSTVTANEYPRPKTAAELANGSFPVPFYLWHPYILAEHVNLLYGDGGTGKTLLALMAAVAVAAGIPLFGADTLQRPVLLVLAEDDNGATKIRLAAIARALGVSLSDLPLQVWCLPGADLNLATVADDGTWTPGAFMAPLRAMLAEIGQPVLLVLDTVSDIAALDETKRLAVNTLCKQVFGSFCRDFAATVLVSAHPSKAAMADGSGYAGSTAWNNSVRSRLTLERQDPNSARRFLRVAKSNYGNNAELELHLVDGVFWQRDQGDAAELNDRLMTACVEAALAAAAQGTPIQMQRRPPKWVFDEIEGAAGRRPTVREVREVLAYAQRAGRVRFLSGTSKRSAGYYPWDQQRAAELAVEAKRHAATVEDLSAAADKREANNG